MKIHWAEPGTRHRTRCRPWREDAMGRLWFDRNTPVKWSTNIEHVTCKVCRHLYRIDFKRTPANDNASTL